MSKPIPENHHDYSHFDNMSTADLEEILRLDSQLPDDEESDLDAIMYITGVIERREKEHSTTDLNTAWASFKENYLPYTKNDKSLYDFEDSDMRVDVKQPPFKKFLQPKRKRHMSRVACIVALLIAILLTGTLTASAFGFDLWGAVAKWTKDTFGFSSSVPRETISDSLQGTLEEYGITTNLSPTWFPEGYYPEDIIVSETPLKITITARYRNIDDEISVTIVMLSEPLNRIYEKDDETVKVYEVTGIEHYIITNLDVTSIVWTQENYECAIIGYFSLEEAEEIINSIYERK